jgi:hypothetical protein
MPRVRYDDQTDYEDPIDRYRPRDDRPKVKKQVKNGAATASYTCGLISLVPCLGAILGPIAILVGLAGLGHARSNPDAGGKERAKGGIWFGVVACLINFGVPAIIYSILLLWR